jgi:phosphatidylglycerol:prolipoprotein diacylglycerol transferase
MDVLAPALILAQGIGRIGCFMSGCCFGRPTELPWSVTFNNPNTLAPIGVSLHPTQLYHSFANFTVFFILFFLIVKRKHFTGQIVCLYLCLYSIARFFLEFFRGDAKIHLAGPLNLTQGISFIIFLTGFFLYWWLKTSYKTKAKML